MVFLIDHHDGSCAYTIDKDGNELSFNAKAPFMDEEYMTWQTNKRAAEFSSLIDDISQPDFLQNVIGLDKE